MNYVQKTDALLDLCSHNTVKVLQHIDCFMKGQTQYKNARITNNNK